MPEEPDPLRAEFESLYARARAALERRDYAEFCRLSLPPGASARFEDMSPFALESLGHYLGTYPAFADLAFLAIVRKEDRAGYGATSPNPDSALLNLHLFGFTDSPGGWRMCGGDVTVTVPCGTAREDLVRQIETDPAFSLEPPEWEKCIDITLFDRKDPKFEGLSHLFKGLDHLFEGHDRLFRPKWF